MMDRLNELEDGMKTKQEVINKLMRAQEREEEAIRSSSVASREQITTLEQECRELRGQLRTLLLASPGMIPPSYIYVTKPGDIYTFLNPSLLPSKKTKIGREVTSMKKEYEQRLRATQSQLEEVRGSIASQKSAVSAPGALNQGAPYNTTSIDSNSDALQKELKSMKVEYNRLMEQMKNDEKRLKTHAGTLAKQLEKYRQKSDDSQKAIRELEDRNKVLHPDYEEVI